MPLPCDWCDESPCKCDAMHHIEQDVRTISTEIAVRFVASVERYLGRVCEFEAYLEAHGRA